MSRKTVQESQKSQKSKHRITRHKFTIRKNFIFISNIKHLYSNAKDIKKQIFEKAFLFFFYLKLIQSTFVSTYTRRTQISMFLYMFQYPNISFLNNFFITRFCKPQTCK